MSNEFEAEYKALVEELMVKTRKTQTWVTRVLKGHENCLGTMFEYLDHAQNYQKNTSTRADRKRLRHQLYMYAPQDVVMAALHRLNGMGSSYYRRSFQEILNSDYALLAATPFEIAIGKAALHDHVDISILTEHQIGRCALVKMLCQGR